MNNIEIKRKIIANIKELYEKIFPKIDYNSKEFFTFVAGNSTKLRIKVEEALLSIHNELTNSNLSAKDRKNLIMKRDLLKELDRIIMEFIENNY